MSVLDASVVFDYLTKGKSAEIVKHLLQEPGEATACAPSVLVFEVISGLRRAELRGEISSARAEAAVNDLGDLAIELVPTLPLRQRAWSLRKNFTAGDALYAALAEVLGEPLFTGDKKLARAAKRHLSIEVVPLRIT